jgi:hypothetical protein
MKKFKINWKYIIGAIILIVAIYYYFTNCSGKGDGSVVIDTKEVKGSFPTVQGKDIEAKDIPSTEPKYRTYFGNAEPKVSNSTPLEVDNFKNKYKLSQKQYDSILVINAGLRKLAQSMNNDNIKSAVSDCELIEFKHELDDDNIHITFTGLSRGAPQSFNLDYLIKSRKDTIKLKQMWFRVFAGAEIGINKELNQGTYKLNLTIQNAKNDLLSASYQRILNDNFYLVGFQKALFTINKRDKKAKDKKL